MRFRLPFLLLLASTLAVACGDGEDPADPCLGVTCLEGQECIDGSCVDRKPPEDGCLSDADCAFDPNGRLCDRGTNSCVACYLDAHCPAGRTCTDSLCVGTVCTFDDQCSGETPFCSSAGDACVQCRGDDHCNDGFACEAGICVVPTRTCESSEECEAPRPECGSQGFCVECLADDACGEGRACIEETCYALSCTSHADCADVPGRTVCGAESRCVECLVDEQCAAGAVCVNERCEQPFVCAQDADCAGNPAGELCDEITGACVGCVDAGDCTAGSDCVPVSDPVDTRVCQVRSCTEQADCAVGSRCDGTQCVPNDACDSPDDCAFDPRIPFCNDASACVACLDDTHCPTGERCSDFACVKPNECSVHADCDGGFLCADGLCNACLSNEQCAQGVCEAGSCVDAPTCDDDDDCAGGACVAGACVECAGNLDCPAGLWCVEGACLESGSCLTSADCGPNRICDEGACVASACEDDDEEPNDSWTQARPIKVGTPVMATLCPNDDDVWVLQAARNGSLHVQLIGAPDDVQMTFAWYDPQTRELRTQRGSAGNISVRALPAAFNDRYYVRVEATPEGGTYTLLAQTSASGQCTDHFEPNNGQGTAQAIPATGFIEGLSACGDDDFYLVEVPTGATLKAWVFTSATSMNFGLFSPGGKRIGTTRPTTLLGGGLEVEGQPENPGEPLFVRVWGPSDLRADYRLFVTVENESTCTAPLPLIETGMDRARAEGSTLGSAADHMSSCGEAAADNVYSIHVDSESRLLVEAKGAHPARLSLREAGCAGAEMACAVGVANGLARLDVPRVAAGDYLLVVSGAPGTAGPYELSAQLLPSLTPPSNDVCAPALEGTAPDTVVAGSTLGASSEGDLVCGVGAPDVWYNLPLGSYHAGPGAARVVIDVEADKPVYVGLGPASTCETSIQCEAPTRKVRIDRQLSAATYSLGIGSATGAPTNFTVRWTMPQPVPGDTCHAARPYVHGAPAVSGDTTWADNNLDWPVESDCTGYHNKAGEVFFAVDLVEDQEVTFEATPLGTHDLSLYVIGDCDAPLCLGGVDAAFGGQPETLAFTAPATGTYFVAVDGGHDGGPFLFKSY